MKQEEIINLVQQKLDMHQPKDYRLDVEPRSVRQEQDWWFVGVKPSTAGIRRYSYYDVMAQVSREIEDQCGVNITLVPPPSGVRRKD
ncbi:MAG: hypothetical protein HC898_05135 [Phycisphaerales bacterium]|nr:hypothetical protein [Phycisphaerales bacterium]